MINSYISLGGKSNKGLELRATGPVFSLLSVLPPGKFLWYEFFVHYPTLTTERRQAGRNPTQAVKDLVYILKGPQDCKNPNKMLSLVIPSDILAVVSSSGEI